MTWGRWMILEAAILLAAGTAAGFTVNALRESSGKAKIELDRQYFIRPKPRTGTNDAGKVVPAKESSGTANPGRTGSETDAPRIDSLPSGSAANSASSSPTPASQPPPHEVTETDGVHPEHEFTAITTAQVAAIVDGTDPDAATTLLIDARDVAPYEEGHIPGAYRCYFSTIDADLAAIADYLEAGYRLVVYCNGGECEDSINLCRMLRDERGVLEENLLLYEDGWKAWSAGDRPVDKGPRS
ncbi:MAG: hypothetical protein KJ057_14895 [Phycisphaerae bacterium]|nr:MAG: rhodanese-like domain-containing protein [Planctomycetota bacterium]KAB2949193.1 MAG: rhodanese-like domain-containing protein [Phycisphaerae bacterium]MBE7458709.1 rhodanese-like domain-containing protein [Planctomycetia bacterium]MCK6466031.1 rhodanese-like domain-containing protein [Phycisphaerae bacterium]MCL4719755.1 hypothetical protein [Phycisphaerae bacterium]